MKQFIYLAIFILSSLNIIGQKTLRYSGDFYNGMRIKGLANFSYILNERNEKIKNGSFRYSAREKNDNYRYRSSITGNFEKNLRQGIWTYNIESKDYERSSDGLYYNISISLIANYNKGKPNGRWYFKTTKRQHRKIKQKNRWRVINDSLIEDISIVLNWKNGILIDSIIINNRFGDNILALMDDKGYLISIKEETNQSVSIENYNNGILENSIIDNIERINYEFIAYNAIKGSEKLIKKKKRSAIYKKDCKIVSYIDNYIYNNSQLLFKYIDGDIIYKKDKSGENKPSIKGLYYYKISPILTPREVEIIKEFNVRYARIKQADWLLKSQIRKTPKNKNLQLDQNRISNALSVFSNINCYIIEYKKFVSLHNTINNSCTSIELDEKIKTKIDFLEELKTITDKQYKILEINHQL